MIQNVTNNLLVQTILFKGLKKNLDLYLPVIPRIESGKYLEALVCDIQGYKCPRCCKSWGFLWPENSGYLYFCGDSNCLAQDLEVSKEIARKNHVESAPKIEEASEKFGLGSRYYNANLSNWNSSHEHQQIVNSWIKDSKNMLVLLGTPGSGKTHFCMAICNWFIKHGKNSYYTNTRRFFGDIQKSIGAGKSQYEVIQRIANYEILIFDDLAASSNTEWQKEVVLDLLDQRYSSQMPTIVTSNLSWLAIKESLGERIERRLNCPENYKIILG